MEKQKDLEVNVRKIEEQCKVAVDKHETQTCSLKTIGRQFRDRFEIAQTKVSSL